MVNGQSGLPLGGGTAILHAWEDMCFPAFLSSNNLTSAGLAKVALC